MKPTIVIILSLLSFPALAQSQPSPAPVPMVTQDQSPQAQSWVIYGNRSYAPDGTVATQQGNRTYIIPPDPVKPQVVCTTYGNVTTCN